MSQLTSAEILNRCEKDLNDDDRTIKLMCARRFAVIASFLKDADSQKKFLKILFTLAEEQRSEDEVLFNLAKFLPAIYDQFPADMDNASVISFINIIARLCVQEETVVRDEAIKSWTHILSKRGSAPADEDIRTTAYDSFQSLVAKSSSGKDFPSQISAAYCAASLLEIYKGDTTQCDTILQKYMELLNSTVPMVRRAVADTFHKVAKACEKDAISDSDLGAKKLYLQDQESIRIIALSNATEAFTALIANSSDPSNATELFRMVVTKAIEDPSWKIRKAIAEKFYAAMFQLNKVSSEFDAKNIARLHLLLLKDPEDEVSIAALEQVKDTSMWFEGEHLMKLANFLADQMHLVVEEGSELPLTKGKQDGLIDSMLNLFSLPEDKVSYREETTNQSVQEVLKRMLAKILDGVSSENPENELIATQVLKRIEQLTQNDQPFRKSLSETVLTLSRRWLHQDPPESRWRLREAICGALAELVASDYKVDETLEREADTLLIKSLMDQVASVRFAAARGLVRISRKREDSYGEHLYEVIKTNLANSKSYLLRQLSLLVLYYMARTQRDALCDVEITATIFDSAMKDKVPNVRMHACKLLYDIQQANPTFGEKLVSKVTELGTLASIASNDSDRDVIFFANIALGNSNDAESLNTDPDTGLLEY